MNAVGREGVISFDTGLAKLSIGDFPLMRMASGLPAICARFRGDFTHGAVSDHREIPTPSHSARSIATGSMRTARIAAGTAARNAAAKRIRDGSASMLTSVAFT